MSKDTTMKPAALETARRWIDESDCVLIGAGAGMSAAAGVDYGDTKTFAQIFPAFAKMGFKAQYQLIGYEGLTPAQHWGYWSTHVAHVRYGQDERPVYQDLRALVADKDVFVLTSNVDMLFGRNGFDDQRLFTPQGDYANMQCRTPCVRRVWPTRPFVERALSTLDPKTQTITDPGAVPHCPNCGGEVFMNVRLDDAFLEEPYLAQSQRFGVWAKKALTRRLCVLEVGAGFNTPSVVRWRMEHLVAHAPDARLVRINLAHPETPTKLADRAIGLQADAATAITRLGA